MSSYGKPRSIPDEDKDRLTKRVSGSDPKHANKKKDGSQYDQLLKKRSPSVPGISDEDCVSRCVEIFFGNLTDFHNFYDALSAEGYLTPSASGPISSSLYVSASTSPGSGHKTRINPQGIKKLVLVGHPLTSFSGIGRFTSLIETWITNCGITVCLLTIFMLHMKSLYCHLLY